MDAIRSSFTTQDGTKIFSQYWKPAHHARAVVVQVHGLGEHSGRYAHVAKFFNAHDIAFYGYDHRGHGRSDGKRGHIPNYEALMEELDVAMAEVDKLFPLIPKILYGHSWGGNMALNYLIRRKPAVACAIVTDAWLILPKVPPLQEKMARIVNGIFPGLTQSNGIKGEQLSKDPKVGEIYFADPLVHSKISVRNFVDCDAAAKYALAHANEVSAPLYIMHGADDNLTLPAGTIAFDKAMTKPHRFKLWETLRHEIHNEPEQQEVFAEMLAFVEANLPK